jgi:cytochrome c biogenesis factor
VRWLFLFLVLEFIAAFSLMDCINRAPEEFAGGEDDRQGWIRWLIVAVLTAWFLVGNGIVLGYYWAVVKRTPVS